MKNLLLLLLFFSVISCKKEDVQPLIPAKTLTDVAYGSDPLQAMDIYLPAGRSTDTTKLIIMLHGGAWASGDKSEFSPYVSMIQQLFPGYAIANINYRLASMNGNFFPVQENDVKAAVDYLLQKQDEYGYSDQIVLFGGSAGGHLALLYAYKHTSPRVKAVVDFFGPTDMVQIYNEAVDPVYRSLIELLMGGTPASNPALYFSSSPVNFISPQTSPTIIIHGGMDDVVHISHSTTLKNKLTAAGVPNQMEIYPAMGHDGWPDAVMADALGKAKAFVFAQLY